MFYFLIKVHEQDNTKDKKRRLHLLFLRYVDLFTS